MRRGAELPREWRRLNPPTTMSAAELMGLELPPVKWAVPGVLPEGVTILAGKPKMGKSWLGLGTCIAVASGGAALGKIRVERGGALYLALEDNHRRLQKRLRKVLGGRPAPEGLELCTAWPQLDQGGLEALRGYAAEHPELRLIVIDTLKKIRPRESGSRSVYDLDYESLEPLLPLAAEFGVAIMVVHHLRKMEAGDPFDMISGSTGLTGGVDGALVLKRDRGKQDATLHIDGRDVEEPAELALRWDADIASWSLMGDAEEFRISEERREIVDLLRRIGEPLGPKEIAQMLERSYGAVRVMLPEMVKDGLLASPSRGKYIPANIANNSNIANIPNITNNTSTSGNVSVVSGASNNPHAENSRDKRGLLNVSDVSKRRLTAEEVERVKALIDSGVAASAARAQVLGEES